MSPTCIPLAKSLGNCHRQVGDSKAVPPAPHAPQSILDTSQVQRAHAWPITHETVC